MENQKEQTRTQLDYEIVIQKAWNNFKSGKSIFSENEPTVHRMNLRSYTRTFAKKTA